ncbi:Mediator of RNA polymerase II transcription subunit 11 [Cyberlindnera fabianii]|nr:Mediator of RNA polymerase II transcription subunit 11 [Cyberlindnera fabianii]
MAGAETETKGHQDPFVEARLEALHEIDTKLVSILDHSSSALENLTNLKKNASNPDKIAAIQKDFETDVQNFYRDLEYASINLKKEIKTLDDRSGKTDANGITMLPININRKATWAGRAKMETQVDELKQLLEKKTGTDSA